MLRSLFAGVSGMRTHQLDMDVIADNIANVNTTGFKAGRMTFKEVYSQLLRSARGPMGDLGGVNPLQVGLGVTTGSTDTLFTQGALQMTGRDLDLAIDGNGFFILTPDNGTTKFYTRAGNFSVDSSGNLVYLNGMKVMGWNVDPATGAINTNAPLAPLRVPLADTMPARATTSIDLGGNLDAQGTPVTLSVDVFDSLGRVHTILLSFTQASPGTWDVQWWAPGISGYDTPQALNTQLQFDSKGRLTPGTTDTISIDLASLSLGADPLTITVDFSRMTQYAQESDPSVISQDGYPPGSLIRFTIDDAGIINGIFSNGLTRNLGQIALATFPNQEGLVKHSETLFSASPNTGEPGVGQPATGNRGKLAASFLEMSNVDLSQEFTNLILAQRGFQANSRVITTSDEMLQELMTLKR